MHAGIANLGFPLKSVAGKTFPAFPTHAQPAILRFWQEAHCTGTVVISVLYFPSNQAGARQLHLDVRSWCARYPNGPEAGREAGRGSEFVPLKKRGVGSFILLHKISGTACCFGIRTFLKQYKCYVSATIWYTDHQYLAQYREIHVINNLQEIPLIFCNYAVRSCGTWRKGPGQSPCNVLSISDL